MTTDESIEALQKHPDLVPESAALIDAAAAVQAGKLTLTQAIANLPPADEQTWHAAFLKTEN